MKKVSKPKKQVLKSLQSGPKTLTQIRRFLGSIDTINCGGCGIAALAIYDKAKKEGRRPKIVFAWDIWSLMWGDGIERHNEYKRGLRDKAPSCSHVLVKIGEKYYDSNQIMTKTEFKGHFRQYDENVSRKHLVESLKNKREWNSEFDRKTYLPIINKKLGYKLLEK